MRNHYLLFFISILFATQSACNSRNLRGYENISWGSTLEEVQQQKGKLVFQGQDQSTKMYSTVARINSYDYEINFLFDGATMKLKQVGILSPGQKKLPWVEMEHALFLKDLIEKYGNPSDTRQEGDRVTALLVHTWALGETEIKLFKTTNMYQEGNFMVQYSSFQTSSK